MSLTEKLIGKIIPGKKESDDIYRKPIVIKTASLAINCNGVIINGDYVFSIAEMDELVRDQDE